ncbi:MAG: CHAT domain-containing protein [Saprospiraceae bacterium]|nr:CHAT domain-containing protein [Saprospiraceae bacterium]
MKLIFFLIFFQLHTILLYSQNHDSITAIRQVDSFKLMGREMADQGDLGKSLEFLLKAQKIAGDKLGLSSEAYIGCCDNLGIVNYYLGNFEEAEKYYLEAKNLGEKVYGKNHPNYCGSMVNLAILYKGKGLFSQAESLYLEAIHIFEFDFKDQTHPYYFSCLFGLANLYSQLGSYEKAEPMHLKVLSFREKLFGKENSDYAKSLSNLGVLYFEMGNFEKAENLQLEALGIRKRVQGTENPDYATSLENLAGLYYEKGNYEQSETLYLEAKSIIEKSLGKDHEDNFGSLHNLATINMLLERYDKAETLFVQALSIIEKNFGRDHPDYASCLLNFGYLNQSIGKYAKAESVFLEARKIIQSLLGTQNLEYAMCLNNLIFLYAATNNFIEAEPLINELSLLNRTLLENATKHLSEHELGKYVQMFSEGNATVLSFAKNNHPEFSNLPKIYYDNSLFYKGFLLNSSDKIRKIASENSGAFERITQLKSYKYQLSQEYTLPINERDQSKIVSLEAKADDLEKELVRGVADYGQIFQQVSWKNVHEKLVANEVGIEFIHYPVLGIKNTDSIMYAALVISSDDQQPHYIKLFEESQLKKLFSKRQNSELLSELYASRGATPIEKVSLEGLYELIWKPLESLLRDVKTIYFAPTGLLHRINFDAIPVDTRITLSDKFSLKRLSSTRNLVFPDSSQFNKNNTAILYGGINYTVDTNLFKISTLPHELLASNEIKNYNSFTDRAFVHRNTDWEYLPGTEIEVNKLSELLEAANFSTAKFDGNVATEESFKMIGKEEISPRVLHIATHGFFFPDPVPSQKSMNLQVQSRGIENGMVFKISDNPMIRSGLILAGGNYAWNNGKPIIQGGEDGILTAYEISQMNLSNTELVVLSACETGLGEIQGNEGVYGLQRAFKIAGTKYLIMSLWQVPDKQTSLLMTTFYKKWLEDKMSIPDAFHAAQKQLRDGGLEPYYWAGFVLVE